MREEWRDYATEDEYLSCCGLFWVNHVVSTKAVPTRRGPSEARVKEIQKELNALSGNYSREADDKRNKLYSELEDITPPDAPSRLCVTGAPGEINRRAIHAKLRKEGWKLLTTWKSRTTGRKLNLWFQK